MSDTSERKKRIAKVLADFGIEASRDEWVSELITDLVKATTPTADISTEGTR